MRERLYPSATTNSNDLAQRSFLDSLIARHYSNASISFTGFRTKLELVSLWHRVQPTAATEGGRRFEVSTSYEIVLFSVTLILLVLLYLL